MANPGVPNRSSSSSRYSDPKFQARKVFVNSANPAKQETPYEALCRHVKNRNYDAVDYLLNRYPSIELDTHTEYQRELPLHLACKNGDKALVERLLQAKANPDVFCDSGQNALQCSVTGGNYWNPEILNWLKKSVKDQTEYINAPDKHGSTILHIAAQGAELEVILYLIDIGADILVEDQKGRTPAYLACGNRLRVMKYFLQDAPLSLLNETSKEGKTYLWYAAEFNQGQNVEWLLKRGVDCSTKILGQTPWEVAEQWLKFDAMAAFASLEWNHEISSYLPPYWINVDGNNGIVRDILASEANSSQWLPRVLSLIHANFKADRKSNDPLGFREATFNFEKLNSTDDSRPEREVTFTSIVMPLFSSETLRGIANREKHYQQITKDKIRYCHCETPNGFGVQLTSTLDEYCNPNLDKKLLDDRNTDQVLTRYQKNKRRKPGKPGYSLGTDKILTVPQIWIWIINDYIITTIPEGDDTFTWKHEVISFLERMRYDMDIEDDERSAQSIHVIPPSENASQASGSHQYRIDRNQQIKEQFSFSLRLAVGLIISYSIDIINRPRMAHLSEPIFSTFEKSISEVSEAVKLYTMSTAMSDINMKKERQFLHDIADIREELSMIKTVLLEQEEVWRDYTFENFPGCWPNGPEDRFIIPSTTPDEYLEVFKQIQKPQLQFAKFRRQISKLDADSERVERSILTQLDLKAKHAGLKETHLTTIMSAAVIGFTLVTIIFTPLAFLASLFALPIDKFQKHQVPSVLNNSPEAYPTSYIGNWMATIELVSLSVTAIAIWVAVEFTMDFPATEHIKRWIRVTEKVKSESKTGTLSQRLDIAQFSSMWNTLRDRFRFSNRDRQTQDEETGKNHGDI